MDRAIRGLCLSLLVVVVPFAHHAEAKCGKKCEIQKKIDIIYDQLDLISAQLVSTPISWSFPSSKTSPIGRFIPPTPVCLPRHVHKQRDIPQLRLSVRRQRHNFQLLDFSHISRSSDLSRFGYCVTSPVAVLYAPHLCLLAPHFEACPAFNEHLLYKNESY